MSSRPTGEAAPPVFSYAQAAKGRAATAAASTIQSNPPITSGISTPAKESTVNTPSGGSERGDRSVNGSFEAMSTADAATEASIPDLKAAVSTKASLSTESPILGNGSASSIEKEVKAGKEDDFTLVGAGTTESSRERSSHPASTTTEKPAEATESRRGKKGKKQKNAEKDTEPEKEELKPESLVPAPLPTVNIWQQRREAAKVKPSPVVVQHPQTLPETSNPVEIASTPTARQVDPKKRGKPSAAEDGDKSLGAAQNGGTKDTAVSGKGQKKGGDGQGKVKDEQSTKRPPRGSRIGDKDEASTASQLPPPVEDAISWPTPETALEEEKRKAQLVQEKLEKEEKDETTSNKPRPKEKWVTVPFVPTVSFNTPVPTRGGRGRGGARGGRTEGGSRSNHGQNGEKAQNTSTTTVNTSTDPERRSSKEGPRASSLPPAKSSDQPTARKPSIVSTFEKSKAGASQNESSTIPEARKSFSNGRPDQASESGQDKRTQQSDDGKGFKSDSVQAPIYDSHSHPQSANPNRRSEPNLRGIDQVKEGGSFSRDNNHQSRERSERGRGGYRGRGGNPNFPNGQPHSQNVFPNGHGATAPNGYPIRQSTAPYSPPLQPPPFGNQFAPLPTRGGRGGSRSQSIPNSVVYGRFPNGGPVPQQMTPIQTSAPMFEYQSMPNMNPGPFNPYDLGVDRASVLAMVTMQLEYYFSIDNLCKDVFLRKHMDSQGFVFLTFIAGFKRIQALIHEFDLLRFACQESGIIELVRGDDGIDRVRRKEGWEKWVLAQEERDPSTRNDGPAYYHHPQVAQRPQHMGPMFMPGQHSMSPLTFSPNGTEASFRHFENGVQGPPLFNGNGNHYQPETPLSAAVPDFAPGLLSLNGAPDPLEAETTFHDDEVAHLTVVFAPPKGSDGTKPKVPFHNASSRTFSNGSIDGRSIAEELYDDTRQGRTLTNGSHASEASPENLRRSRSPFTPLSPTKSTISDSPPVMWVKGQRQPAPVSEHNSLELYTSFRARALQHREASTAGDTHPDMKQLYEFWAHFLCRNFNLTMYSEFRKYATEDAQNKSFSGLKNLISYYDEILNSKKKVIPETLAQHYVDLVRSEREMEGITGRPALEKLRASWRNGALDLKSRKKIDNLIDAKLREEIERAPQQKPDLS